MELHKIELLLEKYFDCETTIDEENKLREYFSSADVAQHLEQYKPMFGYFTIAKEQISTKVIPLKSKTRIVAWLSIAASVVVLIGIGTFTYFNNQSENLGTSDNPEVAIRETQKALALLSGNVNKGLESMQYVAEFESTKNQIFSQ